MSLIRNIIKRLPLVLAVFLIASLLGSFAPVYAVRDNPTQLLYGKYAVGDEVVELRTENSKTRWLGGNRYSAEISIGAIHYKDNYSNTSEQWKDIDLTFVNNQITKAPYILTVNPDNYSLTMYDKKTGAIASLALSTIGSKVVSKVAKIDTKGKMTFKDVTTDTDIEIVASNTKVQFKRILKSDKAPADAVFGISQSGTGITVTSEARYVNASIDDAKIPVITSKSGGLLTETIDKTKVVKYPIEIDPTLDIRVGASADDAYAYGATSFSLNGAYFWFGDDGGTTANAGARFLAVTIPVGATITTAYVRLVCKVASTVDNCNLLIYGEDTATPATFSTRADYDGRTLTGTSVAWAAVEHWDNVDQVYNTPEIKTIITELIGSYNYSAGLNLVIFIKNDSSTSGAYRYARSWDDVNAQAPLLHIEYTVPTCALTGTVTAAIMKADIVAGGETIILTLTNGVWVAAGGVFDAQRQNIINGIDSAQAEAHGWDAEVKAKEVVGAVVRTSNTVVTIILTAEAGYDITAQETITATIPATAITAGIAIIATPTFTITPADPPDVTTTACTGFTKYEAVVNGIMVDDDIAPATIYGFDYGLTTGYGSSVQTTATLADGTPFWMNLTGLLPASVYHYRAKAYSTEGWGYGSDMQFSTEGSPTRYEYFDTASTANSDAIYGNNWGYQQFTVGTISHTVTSINLYVKRVLLPGTVTVSLRHAAGNVPTGNDLVSTTFNGSSISTSYVMYSFPITETALEANQQYAIVPRAIGGDAANYLLWGTVAGGGLADARYGASVDGGLTFTVDAGADDALFEIWGNPAIDVIGAKVFTGYKQAGDWLIVADTKNVYEPYYPNQDPQVYFQLQLIDGVIIKASTNVRAWNRQPLSIYLNKATADTLSWGSGYKVRMQLLGTSVYQEYALLPADWTAGSLLYLDGYVRTLASTYETYYATPFLVSLAGQTNKVLNEAGSIMFIRGVPGLETVRPDLFYTSFGIAKPSVTSHTLLTPNPAAALGVDAYGRVTEAANLFGIDAETVLGWVFLGLALLIGIACVGVGHGIAGLIIGLFFAAGAGFVFGGIPIAIIGAIGFVFLMLIAIWLAKLLFSTS